MDEALKMILISIAIVLGLAVIVGFAVTSGEIAKEEPFRDTIKAMDNRTACSYTCSHEWGGLEMHEQYGDCLNYCNGGNNNG